MIQKSKQELRKVIEELIQSGTSFDLAKLENIYHNDLQVLMITTSGEKMISNKQSFKDLFKTKLENGDAPLNTWASFHHIECKNKKGHVVLTRKVNLTGEEQKIVLSIDLVNEDNRWQVIREVIVMQPN